jgi:hypothetical protein
LVNGLVADKNGSLREMDDAGMSGNNGLPEGGGGDTHRQGGEYEG